MLSAVTLIKNVNCIQFSPQIARNCVKATAGSKIFSLNLLNTDEYNGFVLLAPQLIQFNPVAFVSKSKNRPQSDGSCVSVYVSSKCLKFVSGNVHLKKFLPQKRLKNLLC